VARRQRLSEIQIAELFDPPTERRDLVRHFTLSAADLAANRRCRGDHNRLGQALMLCYLRHPGRALRQGERPPTALLSFVAEQIGVLPDAMDAYLAAERNRKRHAAECQEHLGLRPFGRRVTAELLAALLPQAIEDDRFAHLAGLVMEICRQRRILAPSPAGLERLCAELRYQGRREVQYRLTHGLSTQQRHRLNALTQRREETGQSWLTWLRQMPEAAKPVAMLGVIERLEHVRAIGIEPGRGHLVHQARLGQLAREAGRTSVQHVAGYERQRRHATLVATTLDLGTSLTDQAIDLFDRLIGAMFRKAEGRHARAFQADARAINEKVRLYARIGAALITAQADQQDAFAAITAVIPSGAVPHDRRRSRGPGAAGGIRRLPEARRALRRHPALVAHLPRDVRIRQRAGVGVADARHRGAARGEPHGCLRPTGIRPDRLCPATLGPARPARRRHRPAPLRTLRAVGVA
jgi:hypothetical protein